MFCPICGAAITGNPEKCESCGFPLSLASNISDESNRQEKSETQEMRPRRVYCKWCRNLLEPGLAYCPRCGSYAGEGQDWLYTESSLHYHPGFDQYPSAGSSINSYINPDPESEGSGPYNFNKTGEQFDKNAGVFERPQTPHFDKHPHGSRRPDQDFDKYPGMSRRPDQDFGKYPYADNKSPGPGRAAILIAAVLVVAIAVIVLVLLR